MGKSYLPEGQLLTTAPSPGYAGYFPMNGEELSSLGSADSTAAGSPAQDPDRGRLVLLRQPAHHPATLLVLVEVAVGGLVHVLPVLARPPGRDAHADLDVLRRTQAKHCVIDRATKPHRHVACAVEICLRHGDRELVPADARAHVGGPNDAQELLCDQFQRSVTRAVAEAVVDALEVVEVDHHQSEAPVVALRERDLALHHPLELASVRETGEMVGARLIRELARAVDRDRNLVRHRGHEQQVRGAEYTVDDRADRHHAHGPSLDSQLPAQPVPLLAGDPVDT